MKTRRLVMFGSCAITCATACLWTPLFKMAQVSAAQRATAIFNSGEVRQKEDPAVVAQGKTLYAVNCQACHGQDLRGGDMGGPNLLRSQVTLADQHGENIVPIIQGGRLAKGMPKIGIDIADSNAVAAYIRSIIGTIGQQGAPPGEQHTLNILVGDAERGRTYFISHCQSCHTVDGDLKDLSSRVADTRALQALWVAGGPRSGTEAVTAEVMTASGQTVRGRVAHIDDFLISLVLDDGTTRSFERVGGRPKVIVHDPRQAHQDMLPLYTDNDIHDVTAYLVTLK